MPLFEQYLCHFFSIVQICLHYVDINFVISELVKSLEEDTAWNYYENGTLSIEVLKDDELQKMYFRCKDKVYLSLFFLSERMPAMW